MAEPLLSEDTDLTRLMERIREQHGEAATVLYHDTVRRGGVGGFFAREVHRVAYRVEENAGGVEGGRPAWLPPAELPVARPAAPSDIDDLIAAADTIERGLPIRSAAAPSTTDLTDFATLLDQALRERTSHQDAQSSTIVEADALTAEPEFIDLATALDVPAPIAEAPLAPTGPITEDPAGGRHRASDAVASIAETALTAITAIAGINAAAAAAQRVESDGEDSAPAAAEHRKPSLAAVTSIAPPMTHPMTAPTSEPSRQVLTGLGLPADLVDTFADHHPFEAIQLISRRLPDPPEPGRHAGDILAVVGDLTPSLRVASAIAQRLRLAENSVWIAGLAGHPAGAWTAGGGAKLVTGTGHARLLHAQLRALETPSIVVVAADTVSASPDDPWIADILLALQPTSTWYIADASATAAGLAAQLARLDCQPDGTPRRAGSPGVDALALYNTRLTPSPARALDLGVPIAMVETNAATGVEWAALLLSAMDQADRADLSAAPSVVRPPRRGMTA